MRTSMIGLCVCALSLGIMGCAGSSELRPASAMRVIDMRGGIATPSQLEQAQANHVLDMRGGMNTPEDLAQARSVDMRGGLESPRDLKKARTIDLTNEGAVPGVQVSGYTQ